LCLVGARDSGDRGYGRPQVPVCFAPDPVERSDVAWTAIVHQTAPCARRHPPARCANAQEPGWVQYIPRVPRGGLQAREEYLRAYEAAVPSQEFLFANKCTPAVYGDDYAPMQLFVEGGTRAFYQVTHPFGTDIAGVDSKIFEVKPESEFDTWITVGADNGNALNSIRCGRRKRVQFLF
jgi:hypothetical protein